MNLDFNWIVPVIAVSTILVNLGINIAAQRSVGRSVDKISLTIELLDAAREKHSVQIVELATRAKSVEDWLKSHRRHIHLIEVAMQKNENRITVIEEILATRRRRDRTADES